MFQFVPSAPCRVAGHHRGEPGSILLTPSLQIYGDIGEVPSQMSFLKAQQAQISQPFLIREKFQSLNHLCKTLLEALH